MSSEASIVGYCRTCGKALEAVDASGNAGGITVEGILYCAEHAPQAHASHAHASQTPSSPPPPQSPPYSAPPYNASPDNPSLYNPSPYNHSPYTTGVPPPLPNSGSQVSPGLAFVLGMIPGVGAIYNGQYAKGLVHVVILGVIFSILGNGAAHGFEPLFGVLIPCFWFYMAFEAYHTAKKRQEGEAVDEFSGLVGATSGRPSRFPVAPVLLIAFGVLFLLDNLDILRIGKLIRYWPALLIVFGLYLLYERIMETSDGRR